MIHYDMIHIFLIKNCVKNTLSLSIWLRTTGILKYPFTRDAFAFNIISLIEAIKSVNRALDNLENYLYFKYCKKITE